MADIFVLNYEILQHFSGMQHPMPWRRESKQIATREEVDGRIGAMRQMQHAEWEEGFGKVRYRNVQLETRTVTNIELVRLDV